MAGTMCCSARPWIFACSTGAAYCGAGNAAGRKRLSAFCLFVFPDFFLRVAVRLNNGVPSNAGSGSISGLICLQSLWHQADEPRKIILDAAK